MNKPRNWESTQAFDGSFEQMTPGGHICRITGAKVESPYGSEQLVLALDVQEGSKYDGFYAKLFKDKQSQNPNAKWPCVFRQFTLTADGDASPYFKGLVKSVEESNIGYKWNWQEATLKDKLIGVIFREEEFEAQDGTIKTTIRPAFIRSVAKIREGVDVPEIKRLSGKAGSAPAKTGFTQVQDDEMPF